MPLQVELEGTRLTLYTPVIVAESENYAVATVLREGPSPPETVADAVIGILRGGDARGLTPEEYTLALAVLYGGIILVDIGGIDPVPLSRILPQHGFLAAGTCGEPHRLDDRMVLSLWRTIYRGDLRGALELVDRCSYKPCLLLGVDEERDPLPVGYYSEPLNS
ncbi:MAG: hypothetical protein GSR73_04355 [Desulfurococcales archaeon]|nr:hypothetical protein [Desulfurococcales archaeon]